MLGKHERIDSSGLDNGVLERASSTSRMARRLDRGNQESKLALALSPGLDPLAAIQFLSPTRGRLESCYKRRGNEAEVPII